MTKTERQYDKVIQDCRNIFVKKMKDYGPSWRIMRPQTINDQLFIKAKRIREIETTGVNMVGDSVHDELMAVVNYCVMGLVQLEIGYADAVDMTADAALEYYDKYVQRAKDLMTVKNHDYGEAWRGMLPTSYTDFILTKIERNKSILANNGKTLVSEGADANYFDMLNYAVFGLIKIDEQNEQSN